MSESSSYISNSPETIYPSPETESISSSNPSHVEETFIDLVIKSLENEIITHEPNTSILDLSSNIIEPITSILDLSSNIIEPITSILDLSSNIIEQTFIDLVIKYLENENMKKKIFIALTPEITSVIKNIICLANIDKVIISIVNDGKIDSKDVPNIIVVIQRIYQIIYSLKHVKFDAKKRADITSTSLKYILHILVLERKIKIDEDKQGEFFIQTYNLIDSCVSLLNYSKSLKTKSCFKMFR
jgi:hypothetical protein